MNTQADQQRRVVFITGVSSGIGYALAQAYLRRGDNVVGTARKTDNFAALEAIAQQRGANFLGIQADVRDGEAMRRAAHEGAARFGRLDIVIANAGVGQRGAVADAGWDDLETLLRTNIDGVLHTVRAGVPHLRASDGGHIVLVSSVVFNMTSPYTASYAASKAFVSSIARSLRLELEQDNISVTDVRLGRTATDFNRNRLGAAGYADRAPRLPTMTPDFVAERIVRAVEQKQRTLVLRPFDRLIMLANALLPEFMGRRAMRQYKT